MHKHAHGHGHGHQSYQDLNAAKHAALKKYFKSDYLTKLNMTEKLESGIDVLDVGCGTGMQILELGKLFLAL